MIFCYQVKPERIGQSVEQVLKEEFGISSHLLKNIRLYGSIVSNGVKKKTNEIVAEGEKLEASWDFNGTEAGQIACDSIPILYQDDCFLIVDKPPKLCVHPSRGHSGDSLITRLSGGNFLNVVTRLDRDTSGLVLLAKNGYWHNCLSHIEITKLYYGLVKGKPELEQGTIDEPIERESAGSIRRIVCAEGKRAITTYRVMEYFEQEDCSILEYQLFTGRCHQIRVHSSYIGHPLIGDGLYGNGEYGMDGQRLICGKLVFEHPQNKEKIEISLPDIINSLMKKRHE